MSECVVSPLAKDKDGYPRLKHQGKVTIASRLLWKIMYGDIPEGKLVCHSCDNPSCVNPDHLYLGDFADNMQDKVARGRVAGSNHPRSKVTEVQIAEMRLLSEQGYTQSYIGSMYGICQSQVSAIMRGKRLGTLTIGDNR